MSIDIHKIGRNDKCPCDSGKKFKHCHLGKEDELKALLGYADEGADPEEAAAALARRRKLRLALGSVPFVVLLLAGLTVGRTKGLWLGLAVGVAVGLYLILTNLPDRRDKGGHSGINFGGGGAGHVQRG